MGFNLRSGNGPLKFKQMGATPAKNMKTGSYAHKFEEESKDTPAYLKQFGMGEGTSPLNIVPVDNPSSSDPYANAKKKDPDLDKHIAARNKHKPGSTEYEAEQAKINAAYGKERDQDLKEAQIKNADKKEEPNPDADVTNVTNTGANKIVAGKSKLGSKIKKGLATAGKVAFAGFTGGLKEVYGTDAYTPNTVKAYDEDKDKDKDKKTGTEMVDELINKES